MAKPKNAKNTLIRLMGYLKPHTPQLIFVGLCILISTLASTTGTYMLKAAVDDYIEPLTKQFADGLAVRRRRLISHRSCPRSRPSRCRTGCPA